MPDQARIPLPYLLAGMGLFIAWVFNLSAGLLFFAGFILGIAVPAISDLLANTRRRAMTVPSREPRIEVAENTVKARKRAKTKEPANG